MRFWEINGLKFKTTSSTFRITVNQWSTDACIGLFDKEYIIYINEFEHNTRWKITICIKLRPVDISVFAYTVFE